MDQILHKDQSISNSLSPPPVDNLLQYEGGGVQYTNQEHMRNARLRQQELRREARLDTLGSRHTYRDI